MAVSQCQNSAGHNDRFLVNTEVSVLNSPFSVPTRSLQDHLLRKSSENRVTGKAGSLKEKSKGEIVTGFSSISAICFYKELPSCEVNHQRIWSLSYKPPSLVPRDVIQGQCGNNRKLPKSCNKISLSSSKGGKYKLKQKTEEEKDTFGMFCYFSHFHFFLLTIKWTRKYYRKARK